MRHSPIILLTIVFVSCTSSQHNSEADIRSIEALNQHDVNATLAMDTDAIISQWTDDFVVLQAAGPITRGRSANAAAAKQSMEQMKAFTPIEYNLDVQEI